MEEKKDKKSGVMITLTLDNDLNKFVEVIKLRHNLPDKKTAINKIIRLLSEYPEYKYLFNTVLNKGVNEDE